MPTRISVQPKILDPDPDQMNTDPNTGVVYLTLSSEPSDLCLLCYFLSPLTSLPAISCHVLWTRIFFAGCDRSRQAADQHKETEEQNLPGYQQGKIHK
jgi:hypothetical protein